MSHRPILPALALGFLLAATAWGQHHMMGNPKDYDDGPGNGDPDPPADCAGVQAKITISGTSFSPATVTVDAGQPVCWTWAQSIQHNVKADDGSFTSGSPNTRGNFQRTFTAPGTYGFHCQVHGSPGAGMHGTVIVRSTGDGEGSGSGPGTIGLNPTSYTVDEGAGVVTITVERAGGSDGAASVSVATAPGTAKQNKDYTTRKATLKWDSGDGSPKSFEVPIKNDTAVEPDETFTVKLSKAKGAPLGTAAATVTIHDDDGGGCAAAAVLSDVADGPVTACDESRALCLGGGRFEVLAEWGRTVAGKSRDFKRVTLPESPGSGFFSSPSREEPQILVNVIDRCAENGHFGLDLAAVTDLEFTLRVRDTQTGRTKVYFHPAGAAPETVRDVEAFATCP